MEETTSTGSSWSDWVQQIAGGVITKAAEA